VGLRHGLRGSHGPEDSYFLGNGSAQYWTISGLHVWAGCDGEAAENREVSLNRSGWESLCQGFFRKCVEKRFFAYPLHRSVQSRHVLSFHDLLDGGFLLHDCDHSDV